MITCRFGPVHSLCVPWYVIACMPYGTVICHKVPLASKKTNDTFCRNWEKKYHNYFDIIILTVLGKTKGRWASWFSLIWYWICPGYIRILTPDSTILLFYIPGTIKRIWDFPIKSSVPLNSQTIIIILSYYCTLLRGASLEKTTGD